MSNGFGSEWDPRKFDSEFTGESEEERWRAGRALPRVGMRYSTPAFAQKPSMRLKHFRPRWKSLPVRRTLVVGTAADGNTGALTCPVAASEFVRWVQTSLNQVSGQRLPVTGVMNPPTRSALRKFQEQVGLTPDGIAGPETERALIDAKRAKTPAASESQSSAPAAMVPASVAPLEPGATEPLSGQESEFLELSSAGASFGGDPALQQWARELAAAWASRVKSRSDEQQGFAREKEAWLDADLRLTLAAALKRPGVSKFGRPAILRAWRVGREQQIDFQTLDKSKSLVNFAPPAGSANRLVSAGNLVRHSDKYPVAPLVVRFMQKLLQIHPGVRADTYGNHGLGPFRGRGHSIDLWLGRTDSRGFYPRDEAIALLRAVHQASQEVGAEWRVLYNDYSVARVLNQETRARRVAFIGNVHQGSLNWHGPHPLILHFHLDLAPLSGAPGGEVLPASLTPTQSTMDKPGLIASVASLPGVLANAVRSGALSIMVATRILAGDRSESDLTDLVFQSRHPELGAGYRIRPEDKLLAREWLDIRERVIRPILQTLVAKTPSVATPKTAPVVTPKASQGESAQALAIASKRVPGLPGVTVRELIERWKREPAPAVSADEIPWEVLIAFINYESAGHFFDATHGTLANHWTSPAFYELGIFQTPAGLHGPCDNKEWTSCRIGPPGRENASDPSTWSRLCRLIGANPDDWKNPTTQVRVGLLDLELGARRIRKAFPRLFPTPGTDWDLRMAVLYRFSRGGGAARSFLGAFEPMLANLPEDQRWGFLRDKEILSGRIRRAFKGENVEKKMSLAAQLGYVPR